MCVPGADPLTIALALGSAAASAGGAMYNANQQQAMMDAQQREDRKAADMATAARNEEAVRQAAFEEQQAAAVTEALMKANPEEALLQAQRAAKPAVSNVARAADSYNDPTSEAPVSNSVIADQTSGYEKRQGAKTDSMIDALAMLSALSTGSAGVNDAIARSGSDVSTIGGYRRGSMNANSRETSIPAATVRQGTDMTGDLLLLGGQAAGSLAGGMASGDAGLVGEIIAGRKAKKGAVATPRLSHGGLY